jgi:hypothetical protein
LHPQQPPLQISGVYEQIGNLKGEKAAKQVLGGMSTSQSCVNLITSSQRGSGYLAFVIYSQAVEVFQLFFTRKDANEAIALPSASTYASTSRTVILACYHARMRMHVDVARPVVVEKKPAAHPMQVETV